MAEEVKEVKKPATNKKDNNSTKKSAVKKPAAKKLATEGVKVEAKPATTKATSKPAAKKATNASLKAKKPAAKKVAKPAEVKPNEEVKTEEVKVAPVVEPTPVVEAKATLGENEVLVRRIKPNKVGSILFIIFGGLFGLIGSFLGAVIACEQLETDRTFHADSFSFGVVLFILGLALIFALVMGILNIVKISKNNKLLDNNVPCVEKKDGKIVLNSVKGDKVEVDAEKIVKVSNALIPHKHSVSITYTKEDATVAHVNVGFAEQEDYLKLVSLFNKKN